jgi:MHS family proline/betaine transporter-like MFS transporter
MRSAPQPDPQPAPPPSPSAAEVSPATLRRVTAAAFGGTVIEWFDFAVYGYTASAIAATFFPSDTAVGGLLQTFAVFAVAFAMRPLGGLVFGRLGDRLGRRRILLVTVILMSVSTAAIGLLPGHASLGLLAPVLLTVARCLQGLSAGGEYAGAVAYVIEHSPSRRRAFYASAMPAATFGSFAAAALLCWLITEAIGTAAFDEWGWRIPFLTAIPMGIIAFLVRSHLEETPEFTRMQEERRARGGAAEERPSLREVLRREGRMMLVLGGFIAVTGLSFYIFSTYMTTFLRTVAGMPADLVLASNVIALLCATALAPVMGLLSDRLGRRPVMFAAVIALAVASVPAYLLAADGGFASALAGQLLIAVGAVACNVSTAVMLSEAFATVSRYTASAVAYNVAYAIFGGTAPYVATFLVDRTVAVSPAVYLTVMALLAVIAVALLPETRGRDLSGSVLPARRGDVRPRVGAGS